jgi:hypothetical protein
MQHSRFPCLAHQTFPGICREDFPVRQLADIQMDVAHFATEVAQRCQFKLTGERDALFPRFGFQITGESSEVLHLFSVLLAKIFEIFKTVQANLNLFVFQRLFVLSIWYLL